jgi:hypothetical protein
MSSFSPDHCNSLAPAQLPTFSTNRQLKRISISSVRNLRLRRSTFWLGARVRLFFGLRNEVSLYELSSHAIPARLPPSHLMWLAFLAQGPSAAGTRHAET